MNCREFDERLADLLGGELDPEEARSLEDHAAECPHCRAEYDSLADARDALQELPALSPHEAARQSSAVAPRSGEAFPARPPRPSRAAMSWLGPAWRYAAMLLMGIGIGLGLGWRLNAGPSNPSRAATIPAAVAKPVHPDWIRYARQALPGQESWPTFAQRLALLSTPSRRASGR